MFDFQYFSKRVNFKGHQIQTYTYGLGKKVILALPSFPNTGLYYLFISKYYNNPKYKIISFDIPGWMGWSENVWDQKSKTVLEYLITY